MIQQSPPTQHPTSATVTIPATPKAIAPDALSKKKFTIPRRVYVSAVILVVLIVASVLVSTFGSASERLVPRQFVTSALLLCEFYYTNWSHLLTVSIALVLMAVTTMIRSNAVFVVASVVIILVGNVLTLLFGSGAVSGATSWIFGLAVYTIVACLLELGWPIKCTVEITRSIAAALIAIAVVVVLFVLDVIEFTGAYIPFDVFGAVAGLLVAFSLSSRKVKVWLCIIQEESGGNTPPANKNEKLISTPVMTGKGTPDRVIVPKDRKNFRSIRKGII